MIIQGSFVRMVNNGNPVRKFIVLESDLFEHHLNLLLYEVDIDKQEIEKDECGRASFQWWCVNSPGSNFWEVLDSQDNWIKIAQRRKVEGGDENE